ncbi:Tol-Pal system protein TolB [Campylobacter pinnipediorum subsp. pinnipediorum]|uniref:Tol-Pal system protein TolB n=1 Tax=Campylobacter pinnipediorum subsp. pinnipediorum TaxID=1660067 RepID=A0AAX0LBT8_9BACT|nr:Tol-Pal system protein TolB [Campylobacter pinnipediorum]OPA79658.1 Tol-Pal system protein TolB [Campylobacter pinnipediorum subsp. pinnipediorum]OPA81738.1 Tol-Pal system protein TolB [Campylobacter pinnipediorum subsp. pinnipediorum]
MKKIILILHIMLTFMFASDATISVINQGIALPKIALQDASENIQDINLKEKFFKIMLGDLKVSADFEIVKSENVTNFEGDELTNILNDGTQFIFRYAIQGSVHSDMNLQTKLIDAKTGLTKYQKNYILNGEKYPFLAHKSIVDLTKELNLPSVEWMEKFIIFSKYTSAKESDIVLADYTLTYQKTIISGKLNIFPKWGNKEQSIFYYTGYVNNKPTLFRYNLTNGNKTKIIDSNGMLIASDVSNDGQKILLTMAPQDQPDIYIFDLKTKSLNQITNYVGIDVNGNFVDNDSRIVFVSDRLGYPNIFATDIYTKSVEQMVFHGKNNNSVTTYGNYIVYSSRENSSNPSNSFNIYMISTKTDFIRQLTANGKNNYPRFSSDGESIVFIKQIGSQSSLGVIRINENKSFQFPLKIGKIQSIDW